MRRYFLLSLLAAVLLSHGATASCPQLYLDGRQPSPTSPDVVELCNDQFVDLWDPRTHNPAYAVEVLASDRLRQPSGVERRNDFHADMRLGDAAVSPSDYADSGYDRGHMAPAGDMTTVRAMHQSFSMANMVPQVPESNRGEWSRLEEAVRTLVASVFRGRGYVVTGPLYWGDHRSVGASWVPNKLFKAVYVPGDAFGNSGVAGAWVLDNAVVSSAKFVSLARLRDDYGVDAFPSLPEDVKARAQVPDAVLARTRAVRVQ